MNQPNPHNKPIEMDHKGEPITYGIPIRNAKEDLALTAVGGVIMWFVMPWVIGGWCTWMVISCALFETPGILVAFASKWLHFMPLAYIGAAMMFIAFPLWLYYFFWRFSWKWLKRFWRGTTYRYVGDYQGLGGKTLAAMAGAHEESEITVFLMQNHFDSLTDAVRAWHRLRHHRKVGRIKGWLIAQNHHWQRAWYQTHSRPVHSRPVHRPTPPPQKPPAPPKREFNAREWDEMRQQAYPHPEDRRY